MKEVYKNFIDLVNMDMLSGYNQRTELTEQENTISSVLL